MLRFLPLVVELALLVFCLIDAIQTPEGEARNLGKGWWIALIILVPIVGPVAWLVAGRPTATSRGRSVPWRATATAGFPEYERPTPHREPQRPPLPAPGEHDPEKEWLLEQWEKQLREREERLTDAAAPEEDDPAR